MRQAPSGIERWNGHDEALGHVLWRHALASSFFADSILLSVSSRSISASAGHDVKKEVPGRRACANGVGEAPELDALLVQITDQIKRLLDRASQPVELQDD